MACREIKKKGFQDACDGRQPLLTAGGIRRFASDLCGHLGTYPLGYHSSMPALIQCPVITVRAMHECISLKIAAQAINLLSGEINIDFS